MELMRQRVKAAPLLLEGPPQWGPRLGHVAHRCMTSGGSDGKGDPLFTKSEKGKGFKKSGSGVDKGKSGRASRDKNHREDKRSYSGSKLSNYTDSSSKLCDDELDSHFTDDV